MRRQASDLLVAVALLHGADHLAGGQVIQDQRAPGGVVAAVVKGLPFQSQRNNRQLRRTKFEANTRRMPPRVYWATFIGRPGASVSVRGSLPRNASSGAAARSSARRANQGWSWFAKPDAVSQERPRR